jgi:hypothetical protein
MRTGNLSRVTFQAVFAKEKSHFFRYLHAPRSLALSDCLFFSFGPFRFLPAHVRQKNREAMNLPCSASSGFSVLLR